MNKRIDGKKMAQIVADELKVKTTVLGAGEKPKVVVIKVETGNEQDDFAAKKYVNNKHKYGTEKCNIDVEIVEKKYKTTQATLIRLIKLLNNDKSVHGIIVQSPLPPHIDELEVCKTISPSKDVDGFNPINVGLTLAGEDSFVSCTPLGIMKMFDFMNIDLKGKNVVVVGRSNIVGKPMVSLLINAGATVTCCNSSTKKLKNITKNADIVILAIGKAKYFNQKYFKDGQTIIDVGINFDNHGKMCGDVDIDSLDRNLKNINITPVPGGVGQMTVAMLMSNVVKSYEKMVDASEGTTERK